MFYRCPFCHKLILKWFRQSHEARHTRLKEDGQQEEHVTLRPADRAHGSLDGVPKVYRHRTCGVSTQMPEEIIRSYLVDPLLYGDSSFCCGCGNYVYGGELEWTQTGELLVDYSARLRREYLRDTLRIVLPPASTGGLLVTPSVAKGLRAAAERYNVGPDYYLAVSAAREGSDFKYVAELVLGRNPKTETAVVTGDMAVIVPNEQMEFFKGVVVDYRAEGNGFSCGRYLPEPGKPHQGS